MIRDLRGLTRFGQVLEIVQVRLAEDPMGQFTVALKHLKEEGRNCVVFAEHSPSKSPVVIKYYQHEGDRQHNIDLLQGEQRRVRRPYISNSFTFMIIASECLITESLILNSSIETLCSEGG
jgi:hypothetical protein